MTLPPAYTRQQGLVPDVLPPAYGDFASSGLSPAYGVTPDLDLDFTAAGGMDGLITFTRASSATYFDSTGTMQTAASGVARCNDRQDHDPSTLEPLGFLVEDQRTNLVPSSEVLSGAVQTVVTANAAVAPDGATTADLIVDTAVSSEHYADASVAVELGTTYTWSAFIAPYAAAQIPFVFLRVASNGGSANVFYEFSTGDVLTSGTFVSHGLEEMANGWLRLWIAVTATGTGNGVYRVQLGQGATTAPYVGTEQGCYVWGRQVEAGAFPTSYIKTVGAAATRLADVATITGTNFTNSFGVSKGTFFSISRSGDDLESVRVVRARGDTGNDIIAIIGSNSSNSSGMYGEVVLGGATQAVMLTGTALVANTRYACALAYEENNMSYARGGVVSATDTSASVPTVHSFEIGSASGLAINGHIERVSGYKERLPNDVLGAMTS